MKYIEDYNNYLKYRKKLKDKRAIVSDIFKSSDVTIKGEKNSVEIFLINGDEIIITETQIQALLKGFDAKKYEFRFYSEEGVTYLTITLKGD